MSWEQNNPGEGSLPERQARTIVKEMGLIFDMNRWISTPFRDYPIQADLYVEDCLSIEVQSEKYHKKTSRVRKDNAKRECFRAMGIASLWLWDQHLEYAFQVKRGVVWRPQIEEWIRVSLAYGHELRSRRLALMNVPVPKIMIPEIGLVSLDDDYSP